MVETFSISLTHNFLLCLAPGRKDFSKKIHGQFHFMSDDLLSEQNSLELHHRNTGLFKLLKLNSFFSIAQLHLQCTVSGCDQRLLRWTLCISIVAAGPIGNSCSEMTLMCLEWACSHKLHFLQCYLYAFSHFLFRNPANPRAALK